MKTVNELNSEELLIYSKVLVELSSTLTRDRRFAEKFIDGVSDKKSIVFPLLICEFRFMITFDTKERQFSFGDILTPKGIFDDIIEYGI